MTSEDINFQVDRLRRVVELNQLQWFPRQDIVNLFAALDAERGKAKTVVAYTEDVLIGSDHDYAGKRIIEILTGEG